MRASFLRHFPTKKTAAAFICGGRSCFDPRGRSMAANASSPPAAGEETKPPAVALLDQIDQVGATHKGLKRPLSTVCTGLTVTLEKTHFVEKTSACLTFSMSCIQIDRSTNAREDEGGIL
jgi:hypothetical protein